MARHQMYDSHARGQKAYAASVVDEAISCATTETKWQTFVFKDAAEITNRNTGTAAQNARDFLSHIKGIGGDIARKGKAANEVDINTAGLESRDLGLIKRTAQQYSGSMKKYAASVAASVVDEAISCADTSGAASPANQKTMMALAGNLNLRCEGLIADVKQLIKDAKTDEEAKDVIGTLNNAINDVIRLRRQLA